MARAAPTDEQSQLRRRARRRLIGAIALVTVVVVVMPWVLESEPPAPSEEISIDIPSPDAGSFDPRTEPGKTPSAGGAAEPGDSAASPPATSGDPLQAAQDHALATPEQAPAADKGASSTVEKSASSAADKAERSPAEKARSAAVDRNQGAPADRAGNAAADKNARAGAESAAQSQFVVQVAALADPDKARDLQQQLATRGLRAYTEKAKAPGGQVTRVRVGPFPSREAAEKERERLKALGFEGNVAPR